MERSIWYSMSMRVRERDRDSDKTSDRKSKKECQKDRESLCDRKSDRKKDIIIFCYPHVLNEMQTSFVQTDFMQTTFMYKQPIRTRYLGHVTGNQPIRDQYFLVWSFHAPYHDVIE